MDFLLEYLGFLAKTATVVVAALIVLSAVAATSAHRAMRKPPTGHIEVTLLNDRLRDMGRVIEEASISHAAAKKQRKREAKVRKHERKRRDKAGRRGRPVGRRGQPVDDQRRRVFVLNFNGDIQASAVDNLRLEISAVLASAAESDEVVVRVESAGGMVHAYGLAASQLARVRSHGLKLTAAVDKVAASGGYLVAAVADRILAAPFAVLGSIGVLAQIPNIHRLLKKHDVDVEILTAGRYKRTLDVLGENTEQGREKLREELEDIHALFKEYVADWRPSLDLDAVATGEAWYGQRALDRALVDELVTSDEYLASACTDAEVFEVAWVEPKRPIERLVGQFSSVIESTLHRILDRTMGGFR